MSQKQTGCFLAQCSGTTGAGGSAVLVGSDCGGGGSSGWAPGVSTSSKSVKT